MTSLQNRLSMGLAAVLAILLTLALTIGSYSLRQIAERFVATRLEHDLETLLAAFSFDANGQPHIASERIAATFHQPYSGHYYQIKTASAEIRSRSLWDTVLPLPPLTLNRSTQSFMVGPQNQHLLLVGRAFQVQNQHITIAVTEDFTPVESGLNRLLLEFGLLALVAFGVLLLLQRVIVQRGLAPLEQVRHELPRLARGEIPQLSVDVPAEVRALVTELNRLIALMNQRQQRARHALGNLAHALKTPLTALMQLTDQPPPVGDTQPWWRDLRQQLQHIRSLMERELKRARIAGTFAPGQRVLLDTEIGDLVDTLSRIHRDRGLQFELHVPPNSAFPSDRDDLLELLGNLLDNACQWARRIVRLSANTQAEGVWLRIEDDGPGCPPDQLDLLRQRGVRIDESRAGHGLGLAIVSDIVAQYGGTLRLARSEALGGLLAEVMLPYPTVIHPD